MDEASSLSELSAEAVTLAIGDKAPPARADVNAEIKVSASEPLILVSAGETPIEGTTVEIKINLGFDDQTLQAFLSSLRNKDGFPETKIHEYVSLRAPFKDDALASVQKKTHHNRRLSITPIALLLMFAIGFGIRLQFREINLPDISNQAGASIKALVDRIVMSELQGNVDARNKYSSATGLGQFVDATWMELIKKHRPELAANLSEREILDLRKNPELSRDMTARYVQQNTSFLVKKGLPVTPGSLYLAHFAGPGGAAAILSAPEDVDAATVIANVDGPSRTREKILNGNPFMKRFTVKELKNWADLKMQGIDLELGRAAEDFIARRD